MTSFRLAGFYRDCQDFLRPPYRKLNSAISLTSAIIFPAFYQCKKFTYSMCGRYNADKSPIDDN